VTRFLASSFRDQNAYLAASQREVVPRDGQEFAIGTESDSDHVNGADLKRHGLVAGEPIGFPFGVPVAVSMNVIRSWTESMPATMSLSATRRFTGCSCSAK
jgi:hypothetical protein